jgi:hypothetical protein
VQYAIPPAPSFWLAGFPTDFLVVGSHVCCGFVFLRRGFPTDIPVVGCARRTSPQEAAVASLPTEENQLVRRLFFTERGLPE